MSCVQKITELRDWLVDFPGSVLDSDTEYAIQTLIDRNDALFLFAKFKVGDIVELTDTPVITDKVSWGWLGYKDILVEGAEAKVTEVDWYKGEFRYMLDMIGHDANGFCFSECCLRKSEWEKE